MQRSVIVHAALLDVGAKLEEKLDDVGSLCPIIRQGCKQRWKPIVGVVIRVGPQFQKRPYECQRAVINRIFEDDFADGLRPASIREIGRVPKQIFDGLQIAALIGFVESDRIAHQRTGAGLTGTAGLVATVAEAVAATGSAATAARTSDASAAINSGESSSAGIISNCSTPPASA